MNFARHQEEAERTGRRLLWLHGLASVAVVVAVDALATLVWHLAFGTASDPPRGFHATNVGVSVALIVGGAWLETMALREDGALIARRLGATAVDPSGDPLHRRLQNVLEELAIAARIGVPRAYVLEDEPTINALTAGMDRDGAVVVVTRGALEMLTRAELQGVLAHEVSHVVNGDVRLNTRLVGRNHGLQWVALLGRSMLARAFGAWRVPRLGVLALLPAVPLAVAGAVVVAVGSIGAIAARAIQSGVGRQREYHADAQAVAFTRDRDGLGGALRKVAGQMQAGRAGRGASIAAAAARHPYWSNVSHLLLQGRTEAAGWFDTHPPLAERVRRLYGHEVPPIEPQVLPLATRQEPDLPALDFVLAGSPLRAPADDADPPLPPLRTSRPGADVAPMHAAPGASPSWVDTVPVDVWPADLDGDPTASATAADEADVAEAGGESPAGARLVQATRDPVGAAALVIALIESPDPEPPRWDPGWSRAAARHPALRAALGELFPAAVRTLRWPLMELAAARLRTLSRPSREALLATARERVLADGRVTLREWIHFGLLRRRLAPQRAPVRLPVLADPGDARGIRVLFALVAHCAHVSETRAERAANAAIRALGLAPIGAPAGLPSLDALETAIQRAAMLPPLARPLLVRQLVALLPPDAGTDVRDFLRLLCVAIDCPLPQLPPRRAPGWSPGAHPPAESASLR